MQAAYDVEYNTKTSDQAQVVATSDLVHGVFPEIFKGISALIHVASPLPGREEPEALIDVAVEATRNILRQAEKAGITRIVVTSSIASTRKSAQDPNSLVLDTGKICRKSFSKWKLTLVNGTDWNTTTKEAAIKTGIPMYIYATSKTYAERAVWEFADAHPHVDITTRTPSPAHILRRSSLILDLKFSEPAVFLRTLRSNSEVPDIRSLCSIHRRDAV